MQASETLLRLAGGALPEREPGHRNRAPVADSRVPARRRGWTGSSLIENFSEFLAARNLINQTSTYGKIVDEDNAPIARFAANANKPGRQKRASPLRVLVALITGRERNKSSALISLLKAPAVLAALFSLALTASLIVLYTMTFHAHNLSQLRQHRDNRGALSADSDVLAEGLRRALTVQTECGRVVGSLTDRAVTFTGIPYATPPVGKRRWRRPQPVWHDPQLCRPNATLGDAGRNEAPRSDHCSQLSPFKRRFSGSEDCLYLDIYSAQLDPSKKLPVMLYIHGGFHAFGSSGDGQVNWMKARPSGELASELNVVLVAPNFRLQALGFVRPTPPGVHGDSLGDIEGGNYGLWDQLVALKWVKRNIEAFGGDPDNIVIFGPDSASALPLSLISQHQSDHQSLFRAAWLTNPSVFFDSALTSLFGTTCHSDAAANLLECLLQLTDEQVIRSYLIHDDPSDRLDDQNSLPVHGVFASQLMSIDGELVQDSFPFKGGEDRQVDRNYSLPQCSDGKSLLIGSSAQAVGYWPCPRNLSHWSWPDFRHYASTSLASFQDENFTSLIDLYSANFANDSSLAYLSMVSDVRQTCPTNMLQRSLSNSGHSVSRYFIDTPYTGAGTHQQYALHYWDLIAFFGYQFDGLFRPSSNNLKFQANIRSMVRRFVHDKLFKPGTGYEHVLFDRDASVRRMPGQLRERECDMWYSRLGSSYSWRS